MPGSHSATRQRGNPLTEFLGVRYPEKREERFFRECESVWGTMRGAFGRQATISALLTGTRKRETAKSIHHSA